VGSYLLVQISDVHLTANGLLRPGVMPRDNLVSGLRLLEASGIRPDVFLLTGDLADSGEAACYDDLAAILAEAARGSGASVVYVPGNHDERDAFRRHLLGGPVGSGSPGSGPINQTHSRDGLRIIAIDSTIPGEAHGFLDDETLDFLRTELETTAPDGTVVALHHPPIPSPVEPISGIRLREPERVRDAIAGSDVRIVVCGHNHHQALGSLGTVPVWIGPATAYQADLTSTQTVRAVPGAAFSRIDVSADTLTATVIPVS
jgi:3',5'-cyclic-AMP phosphodiesterase